MKKELKVLLAGVLALTLGACGSSSNDDQSADTETETETETETQEEETEEETAAAESNEPYTDASAFAGFDSFTTDYSEGYVQEGEFISGEVVLGKTLLKEHYTGAYNTVMELENESHSSRINPEEIDPRSAATVTTTHASGLSGALATYLVYNPSDEPAAVEDCVIIGEANDPSIKVAFSNGFTFYSNQVSMQDENPADQLKTILGEPYKEDSGEYQWRDAAGGHVFTIRIDEAEGKYQMVQCSYSNMSLAK